MELLRQLFTGTAQVGGQHVFERRRKTGAAAENGETPAQRTGADHRDVLDGGGDGSLLHFEDFGVEDGEDFVCIGRAGAQVFTDPGPLFGRQQWGGREQAPHGGRYIIYIVHHSNCFAR